MSFRPGSEFMSREVPDTKLKQQIVFFARAMIKTDPWSEIRGSEQEDSCFYSRAGVTRLSGGGHAQPCPGDEAPL